MFIVSEQLNRFIAPNDVATASNPAGAMTALLLPYATRINCCTVQCDHQEVHDCGGRVMSSTVPTGINKRHVPATAFTYSAKQYQTLDNKIPAK